MLESEGDLFNKRVNMAEVGLSVKESEYMSLKYVEDTSRPTLNLLDVGEMEFDKDSDNTQYFTPTYNQRSQIQI